MAIKERTPETRSELLDALLFVYGKAPDNFPYFDRVPADRQLTVDSEMAVLNRGLDRVYRHPRHAELRQRMHEISNEAFIHFEQGQVNEGRQQCGILIGLIEETQT